MKSLHPCLFLASFSSHCHVSPFFLNSCSVLLLQVFLDLPFPHLPCGFRISACLVIAVLSRLRVWPVHLYFLSLICSSIGCCLVRSHRLVLLMVFGQKIPRRRLKHLLVNVCNMLVIWVVVFQVSAHQWSQGLQGVQTPLDTSLFIVCCLVHDPVDA